jgi:hypothetical protein
MHNAHLLAQFSRLKSRHVSVLEQRDKFRMEAARLRAEVANLQGLLDEQSCLISDLEEARSESTEVEAPMLAPSVSEKRLQSM